VWYNKLFYPHSRQAYIISAGPSMEKYVTELNLVERMKNPSREFTVFCVKHSLPRLIKMGVNPDFCIILDGRSFDGVSTHGVHRKSLFETIPQETTFLVASMSHPDYAKYLIEHGANVMGWHTAVTGLEDFAQELQGTIVVNGGTSSGTRAISLAHNFGFRKITLVGFDSCIHDVTPETLNIKDDKGRPKYLPVDLPVKAVMTLEQQMKIMEITEMYAAQGLVYNNSLSKRFFTTGELLAQAQDFEQVFGNTGFDVEFEVLDDGIVNHMFKGIGSATRRSHNYAEYFRNALPRNNVRTVTKRTVELTDTPKEKPKKKTAKKKGVV
jgi:hypothetical protein